MKKNLGVLLSGSGRTLENFLEKLDDVNIKVVISSKQNVKGIEIAKKANIPTYIVQRKKYDNIKSFSDQITKILKNYDISLIALAGFLSFYDYPNIYENKILNIHPALIPSFSGKGYYGMKVHKAAYKRGVKVSGCTVHFIDKVYDNGPIVLQKTCRIKASDKPKDIADKVFELECKAYPEAIRLFFYNKLKIKNNKVFIKKEK